MLLLLLSLWGAACINLRPMPPEQPCLEVGYAISSRVFDCTGDADRANAAYLQFEEEYDCVLWELDEEPANPDAPIERDLFHCASAIGGLSCEQVDACGQDLDCFLAWSPTCALVLVRADGSAIDADEGR